MKTGQVKGAVVRLIVVATVALGLVVGSGFVDVGVETAYAAEDCCNRFRK